MGTTKYSAERRMEILKLLELGSYLSVADLAQRFHVSRASVRRDLNELCDLGMLERTYGGAHKTHAPAEGLTLEQREVSQREEKQRIGKLAGSLVQAGEIVFVDPGTTTACVIPALAAKPNITVVTSCVSIVNRLLSIPQIDTICLGGFLERGNVNLGGFLALTSLESFGIRFDKFFLAASAVSAKTGATEAGLELIPVKRKVAELSREVILLADSSKVGQTVRGLVVPAGAIHRLITGTNAPPEEVERLRKLGVIVDLV